MKKIYFFAVIFAAFSVMPYVASAQQSQVFNFDQLIMPDTGFWNGADTSNYKNYYGDDIISFENFYNQTYDSWSGFSFCNWTDSITEGYTNQWSTFAGHAASGNNFGLAYIQADWETGTYEPVPINMSFSAPVIIDSLKLTNNTYSGKATRDGDMFHNAYTTDDYYFVRIIGYFNDLATDSVDFYLADFTNDENIVVQNWKNVDLSTLDTVTSIKYSVFSSDEGDYGINTPTYFCIDDIAYKTLPSANQTIAKNNFTIYPNPTADYIHFSEDITEAYIFDLTGRLITTTSQKTVDVSSFSTGTYIVKAKINNEFAVTKFIKYD